MDVRLLAGIAFGLGAIARVFVPWLIKRVREPDSPESKWNWRYLWPQLVTVLVLLLVAPLVAGDLDKTLALAPVPAYLSGWAIADLGKTIFVDTGLVKK